ncbi:alpha/beta fold hydrolase [Pseudaestuariivita atlantica]|uniref:Alpha/beta hydrolase n=1 Tax=Pseudaestuariivita atlantica TaxID=1317121 RepID=A0A0L1JUX3_9RHOB|nr:alpha/beta hydrolase [Pseudaestuariivita atlantica]KNG95550.1 alpha/beta hydrolase [Pseudaestuariivita atlantica]
MGWKGILTGVALLAATGATVTGCAAYREAQAEEDNPPIGRILDVDGHPVHAWVKGSGPDVVLIHGSSGNLRDFTHSFAGRLTDRYRVIAFDRPGLGYTPEMAPGGDSMKAQAALLQKAAAQLGANRPIVVGQSLGGAVALAWATYTPDTLAALVTISGVSHPWTTPLSTYYKVLSNPVGQHTVVPLMTAFVPESTIEASIKSIFDPFPVPDGYADYVGARLTLRRASLRANADQRARLLSDVKTQSQLYGSAITVPVEVVHGTEDSTVGPELHVPQMERDVPQTRVTLIAGAGHMPHHTHPDPVVAAIDSAAARAGLR